MIAWVDASFGASGDMMLGALVGAGVPLHVLAEAVDAVAPGAVQLEADRVRRGGTVATRVRVRSTRPRDLSTPTSIDAAVAAAADGGRLSRAVSEEARSVFRLLAGAEAGVHGVPVDEVHLHEVADWDSVADVVAACAGLVHLGVERIIVAPVGVGSGTSRGEHGILPVPVPAVVELLRGAPTHAGPATFESCTPTGAALLAHWVDSWGPQPAMSVAHVGIGAGSKDPDTHANTVRILVGHEVEGDSPPAAEMVLLETTVDDTDPRLFPGVIARALQSGAADAWITPVVMKKGRPGHVVTVLSPLPHADALATLVLRETSAIGLRRTSVQRTALERTTVSMDVHGHKIDVKVAWLGETVVSVQPEFEDVVRYAEATDIPAKQALADCSALARRRVTGGGASPVG